MSRRLYHGSPNKFDVFEQRPWTAFDRKTVQSPIWLTPDKSFAVANAGVNGWVYTVQVQPNKTFPTQDLRTWEGPYLVPTSYGERLLEDMIARGMFGLGEDDWYEAEEILKSIDSLDYDTLETGDFISWLKDNGYDSFKVRGDGPTNIAMLDASDIHIVSRTSTQALTETDLKQFYGSNFQHTLKGYTRSENGLAAYGVHYSDYKKWGLAPQGGYFPRGVYFYFLSDDCDAAIGNGFATKRQWANIARIDNSKMVILKQGHPQNFDENKLKDSLARLQRAYGNLPSSNPAGNKFRNLDQDNPSFAYLGDILSTMEKEGIGSFNKLLHVAGYDGIVDYNGSLLPIESCQGVQTWPGGAELIESIPTPKKSPSDSERLSQMLRRLKNQPNGSLKLTRDEIEQVVRMLPKFYHIWDISDSKSDLYGHLLQKLNFDHADALKWLEDKDYFGDRFYMELEQNPTTPKKYWEQLLGSPDHGARLTAKDMLGECFSKTRWQKLAGILSEEKLSS